MITEITKQTTNKIIIELVIERNIEQIKRAFQRGYTQAMYSQYSAGIEKAFSYTTNLIPDKVRKSMTLNECMIFNSRIKSEIAKKIEA